METILEQPCSPAGNKLKKDLRSKGLTFTTVLVEAEDPPKLLYAEHAFPYTGYKNIENFLNQLSA